MNRQTPMKPEDDIRETPPELFAALHARFHFTLDACATPQNAKLPRFNSEAEPDKFAWRGERVFFNPPFSQCREWVVKGWIGEAELAVGLVPATRTEQPWWHELIEPYRDRRDTENLRTEFLKGRIKFLENGGPIYRKNKDGTLWINPKTGEPQISSPKFGCVLLIWGR
jgi:hypothetical protein